MHYWMLQTDWSFIRREVLLKCINIKLKTPARKGPFCNERLLQIPKSLHLKKKKRSGPRNQHEAGQRFDAYQIS